MRHRPLGPIGILTFALAVALSSTLAAGQNAKPAAKAPALKTAWGDPDLQGRWTNTTTTPLERPANLAGKEVLTAEERAQLDAITGRDYTPLAGDPGAYNRFWTEPGTASARTSLIVDPVDGKLPPFTPEAKKYADALEALRRTERPASWEELNPYDRCLTRGLPGAMMPGFYNHNYQILQTPTYVAILIEMIHDVRIIPIDGRPHLGKGLRQWMGDSRGRWEGQTLVVETTGFTDKIREFSGHAQRLPNGDRVGTYYGSFGTPSLTLVERFTRLDANTIDYRFTVTDPATFTRSWTAAIPMTTAQEPIFEYACHEGNKAVPHVLSAARAQDRAEAQKSSRPQ
jgi:hypothetical protein